MNLLPHNFNEKAIFAVSMLLGKLVNGNKNLKEYKFNKILVFKLDEIGDLCYSLHVFDLLKERYPEAKITLLTKSYCKSLVNSHPSIDKVLIPTDELNGDYDLIVDLRGNWSTIWYAVTHWPKVRLDRGTVRYQNKKAGEHPHEVITNTQIIAPLLDQIPEAPQPRVVVPATAIETVEKYLGENKLTRYAVLHCGARRILRRWPGSQFAALAMWLKQTHQMEIVLTGDKNDNELVESIQKQIPFKSYNTCSLFDLTEFAALVQRTALYVGNESGPLCIASVSGAPSLGLFGPGEPIVFYPYGKNVAYIHHVLECNPCDQIHCVHPENPCIERITLQEVKLKVEGLLAKKVN